MIRAVLDTNIIVSALLQPSGPPAQVFGLVLGGSMQLCLSGKIYAEYEEVIRRPRLQRTEETIAGALRSIRELGLWVKPTEAAHGCSDPDDDMFLECAAAAQADYIVTGNLRHFPEAWEGTRVATARRLLEVVLSETKDK